MYNSDNGSEVRPPWDPAEYNILRASHRKTAYALEHSILEFVRTYGIECCGVFSPTFPEPVRDHAEVQRRWNNAKRRLLSKHFSEMIMVKERHRNGGWHYHVLCLCHFDIHTGFDSDTYRRARELTTDLLLHDCKPWPPVRPDSGASRSFELAATEQEQARSLMTHVLMEASPHLLEILDDLKQRLPGLGFGRFEFCPIWSNAEAVAKYFSKQFCDMVGSRALRDKNVRLISYTKGARFATSSMAWIGSGKPWREAVKLLDSYVGSLGYPSGSMDALAISLGSKWGYELSSTINAIVEHGGVPPGPHEEIIRQRLEQAYDGQESF